jgi:hypothetical protein
VHRHAHEGTALKLYHFTSVNCAESICYSSLSRGHLRTESGEILHRIVWLTTSPLPEGHGLLTGEEHLTDRQAAYMAKVQGEAILRNRTTTDKTCVRITIDTAKLDDRLIKFSRWARLNGMSSLYISLMGLSAYHDLGSLPDEELRRARRRTKTREDTWYLHFGAIEPQQFLDISYKQSGTYVPYSFEKHGREVAESEGLAYLCEETLQTLREIVHSQYGLDQPKAHVFVANPDDSIRCIVRCSQFYAIFDIDDHCKVIDMVGTLPSSQENALRAWVVRHYDEIQECHQRALAAYYKFYPPMVETLPLE